MKQRFIHWSAVLITGCALIACGDDDSSDAADHDHDGGGDHDHDAAGSGGSTAGRSGSGGSTAGRSGSGGSGGSGGAAAGSGGSSSDDDGGVEPDAQFSFFVTSDTSATGDLGGLTGADARCDRLAKAVGSTRKFVAYLSTEKNAAGDAEPINARDRIGTGPWYNVKGDLLAADVAALHALTGNAALFIDENGEKVNGQWDPSITPNQHDILTGSDAQGNVLAGKTCADWTSTDAALFAQVGHSDGLGPMMNAAPPYNSWNSVHESGGCNDTAPKGGAGKFYCFAVDE